MIYRKACLKDIAAIVEISVVSVSREVLPVTIDRAAMARTAKECLGPSHFAWVTEKDGVVVAAVVACVQPSFWFTRSQCSVLLYYTLIPGAGMPLIREFAKWIKARPAVKLALLALEPGVDPRLVRFFKRLGFQRESINLTYVRGN